VFVHEMSPNLKGNIAEAAIMFRGMRAGIEVLRRRQST